MFLSILAAPAVEEILTRYYFLKILLLEHLEFNPAAAVILANLFFYPCMV
ncbi:MAG: hypothetical protein OdinLCB4_006735 [Candidatus Odinarchaeum yellowstonii]|uniref:Uncharacterized protein n=1 Tax=Odinarchaeota yellowstonii (strain LCB_4) TaxID=1841599 RepID=A0AAF0D1V0_ODILC|nr:MAG: hypothetical protein OdinLCB4_006735 [Candidatus Odinarchaeum yellowstonii]